ncbi:integrator complex subunit 4-like isoform X1 [Watersipora subatra]|uniref:integrator complex subunit 4-like isoform X1 n=1 Tax=Watersipora subatra TaxID=2589382 RepID=UPI00355AD83F
MQSIRRKADDQTFVVEEPPRKILRLRHSVDEGLDINELDVDSVAIVRQLSRIERKINNITDFNSLLSMLMGKLKSAKLVMVKTKIVQLIRKIVANNDVDLSFLADEISGLLEETDSHQFKKELLSLCSSLCSQLKSDSDHFVNLMNTAKECMQDRTSSVRSSAILLIGDVIKHGKGAGLPFEDTLGMQLIVIDFIKDPEPRVRSVALETLVDLHDSGTSLESTVYEQLTQPLNDDYERVRSAALRLTTSLALSTPDRLVTAKSALAHSIPMLDDGFAKVCDAVNDLSYIVRTQAARLMANFVGVSQHFLEQTLDKKLMSNMKRKQSGHERQRELYKSGEWSSGKRFGDDAPKELLSEDSVSLISMGACGAFVHALEDEFMEVRGAAVESMCVLALSNPSYARQTQDFLVDMFNDEIQEVRLLAIQSLCKIAGHLCLRDDQVEIISGVLKDFGDDIRQGIQRLIQACKVATHTGLRSMILSLLENMRKYPIDKLSIWRAMKDLGYKHPGFISLLLPELLSIDPHFEMPEPNMDDDCYVAVMLAVFNAASQESGIITLFPPHTQRHYRFHRSRFPHMVPRIPELEQEWMMNRLNIGSHRPASHLIKDVEEQLSRADNLPSYKTSVARAQLLSLCLRDLKHIKSREGTENLARAGYLSQYIKCLLLFHKVDDSSKAGSDSLVLSFSQQVVGLCERLLNLYSNVSDSQTNRVRQFQLLALTLRLSTKMNTNSAQADEFKLYLEQLTKIKRQLSDCSDLLPSVSTLFNLQEMLEGGNWTMLQSAIVNLDLQTLPFPSNIPDSVNCIQCELEQPTAPSDNPRKFTAGLAINLPVRAVIRNLPKNAVLYVKVRLPDQSEFVSPVKSSDIIQGDAENELILTTSAIFSHGHWTESSCVEVVVLSHTNSLCDKIEICPANKVYLSTRLEKKAHSGNLL